MPEIKFKLTDKPTENIQIGGYTDHMFCMHHRTEGGWMFERIIPTSEFSYSPQYTAVRQALCVCDSIRITLDKNDRICLFRANSVILRLCKSAKKMRLPEPDTDFLLDAVKALADTERAFLNEERLLLAEITLGGEAGDTFPIKRCDLTVMLKVLDKKSRHSVSLISAPTPILTDGVLSAHYLGMSALENARARSDGFDGKLWLDAVYNRYILSASGSDVFFRTQYGVITPDKPLVYGVMRDSVIQLCDSWGINISVCPLPTDQLIKMYQNSEIQEAFVCSQEMGIIPLTKVTVDETELDIPLGKLCKKLSDSITNIENGTLAAPEKWTVRI